MTPEVFTIVCFLLSAVCGYGLARRANSFNHWGNALVGVSLLSLAWLAVPEPIEAVPIEAEFVRDDRLTRKEAEVFTSIESEFMRLAHGQEDFTEEAAR